MKRPHTTRRRRTSKAMTLEELEDWIDHLEPSPRVDGVSMLDGYLAAVIIGPCSISPYEWMDHMLGPHGDIRMEGAKQTAAIMGVVDRFNAVSENRDTGHVNCARESKSQIGPVYTRRSLANNAERQSMGG